MARRRRPARGSKTKVTTAAREAAAAATARYGPALRPREAALAANGLDRIRTRVEVLSTTSGSSSEAEFDGRRGIEGVVARRARSCSKRLGGGAGRKRT